MKTVRFILCACLLALPLACTKSRSSSMENPPTGGQTKPASGLSGTIQFVHAPTDFKQLAQENLKAEWSEGEVIVMRREGVSDEDFQKEIQNEGEIIHPKSDFPYYLVRSPAIRNDWKDYVKRFQAEGYTDKVEKSGRTIRSHSRKFLKELAEKEGYFSKVFPNYKRKIVPITTSSQDQWAIEATQLESIWDKYGHGSKQITVAVVDTGIRPTHPNLVAVLDQNRGYDFVNDDMDGDEDPGPDANPDEPTTLSPSFHGTHVAGIIAANPSGQLDIDGVAGNVTILPVRVLGEDGGTDFDVAQGILYAAGLLKVEGRAKLDPPADIINLSLGGPAESALLKDAIRQAAEAGVVVVVAAGNEHTNQPSYPAAYPEVIAVGAYGEGEQYAPYSNYGPNVDIMAPGTNILSSWVRKDPYPGRNTIASMSGTSMASPFVAGVIALLKSIKENLSFPDIRKLLFENANSTSLAGCNDAFNKNLCGRGALDLPLLFNTMSETTPSGAKIELAKDWMVGTPKTPTVTLRLINSGSGQLEVIRDEPLFGLRQPDWLESVTTTTDSQGILVTCVFDQSKLGNQPVATTMHLATNAVEIRVTGKNGGKPSKSGVVEITVGYEPNDLLHVALLNESDRTPLAWTHTSQSTNWTYHFDPPPSGNYLIFAGNDQDQDGSICSAGDACGAYPSLTSPKTMSLSNTTLITNLNFSVHRNTQSGFEIPLPKESAGGETK